MSPSRVGSVCFLFVAASLQLNAQTVTLGGIVRDSLSLEPLDSARITITNTVNPNEQYSVFTNSQGTWSYTFSGSTDVVEPGAFPSSLSVEQNYPNPFNPSTLLRFSITQRGVVRISVYNVLGQQLAQRSYALDAGGYSIPWHSTGAAGTLLYSVEAGGTRVTKKMIQLDGGTGGGLGVPTMTQGMHTTQASAQPFSADYNVVAERYDYEPDSTTVPLASNSNITFGLQTVHRRAFLFDLHNDVMEIAVTGYQLGTRHTIHHSDLPRFREGGVDAQMFSIWPSPTQFPTTAFQRTIQMIDSFDVQVARNFDALEQARTWAEVQQVHATGRLAGVIGVEGGHAIENDVNKLVTLYNRGARYLTITWNNSTAWATAAADAQSTTRGLSDLGRQFIKKMDTLGMIIDVSHTGIKTIEDILQVTTNPIIASHSGVRSLRNHYRNLSDAQIISLAQRGGVIGVVFYPPFLSAASPVTIDTVLRHINYLRDLVGVNHIAIGSDFDGIEVTPVGLEDVTKFPALTAALLRQGYSRVDVRKILGENYLRVFKIVCR